MTSTVKLLLSLFFRILRCSRYQKVSMGHLSRVAFWRIHPIRSNQFTVGVQSAVETKIIFERDGAKVAIGDRTFIGGGVMTVADSVLIGSDVMIAWGVSVSDHDSHSTCFSKRKSDVTDWLRGTKDWSGVPCFPVIVCDKAWIGFNSIILKGVKVGEGAVVGAGSVVTKDVPPWTIVAGNPARVIREIPENER